MHSNLKCNIYSLKLHCLSVLLMKPWLLIPYIAVTFSVGLQILDDRLGRRKKGCLSEIFTKNTVLAFFYVDFYLKPGPPVGFDFPEDME